MHKIKEAIVVEGTYDKIRLSGLVDALIIPTDGFSIFEDAEKTALIRQMAAATGIVILTDSDAAGFAIRNHVKQGIAPEQVKHAYIPDVFGKERRKRAPGKEGKLGVEGIDGATLIGVLRSAGATFLDEAAAGPGEPPAAPQQQEEPITKTDLFLDGFSGGPASAARRRALLQALGLPVRLSANMLLGVLNRTVGRTGYEQAVRELDTTNE